MNLIDALNMKALMPLRRLLMAALLIAASGSLRAGIPEPDTVFFGSIALDGAFVTSADTDVVVELRATENGPVLASYRMGSSPAAGNRYVLRLKAEHAAPVSEPDAVLPGATVHLSVLDSQGVREKRTHTVAGRGEFVAINFGDVDTDGDGMSDGFESLYFGGPTLGNPDDDSDADGRPNRREFLQGTNPLVPDGRHPADLAPADDRLTIQEVTDYILAWKTGATNWPVEPSLTSPNIVDYVTRAGALWKGGELYVFDNTPPTNAPMWWVNPPGAAPGEKALASDAGSEAAAGVAVRRELPASFQPYRSFRVSVTATPRDTTRAFAVVETPPEGWLVRNLSHEGRWDAARRQIKWGPFFDTEARTLTYEAVPITSAQATFSGRGSFDGFGITAAGAAELWPPGLQPARLTVLTSAGGRGLEVEVRGEAKRRYLVEGSAELGAPWILLETVTLDAQGQARWSVPVDTKAASFFRLRAAD